MISFIISNSDKSHRQKYIKKYCQDLSIDQFDITVIEKETALKKNVDSIGIEEIKNMQKKIFLKPIKSKTKAVILEDAHMLTVQAQNALLKILEEPPENTIIMLATDSKEPLLPTIISRCQIIEIKEKSSGLSKKEIKETTELVNLLSEMSIGERLKKAEVIAKDKQKARIWITNLIFVLREKLIELASSKDPDVIDVLYTINTLQKTYTLLKTTNINPRLAIENALLSI